jgi:4-hydroxy-tetrahydrodipicolinate reductase
MLSLGIIGSSGRFGQAVLVAAAGFGIPVVLTSERSGAHSSGVPAVLVCAATQPGVEVAATLAADLHRPLVVATSGLLSSDRQRLAELAKTVPVLVAANLTRGHQIQRAAVAAAAGALAPGEADRVTIVDRHSPSKTDRLSATALALAAAWSRAGGCAEVTLTSIRAGAPVADHSVLLTLADDETLIIEHRVPSLTAAARGALRAAAWLANQPAGEYDSVPSGASFDAPPGVPADVPVEVPVEVPAEVPADARSRTPAEAPQRGRHDVVACA